MKANKYKLGHKKVYCEKNALKLHLITQFTQMTEAVPAIHVLLEPFVRHIVWLSLKLYSPVSSGDLIFSIFIRLKYKVCAKRETDNTKADNQRCCYWTVC